MTDTDDQMNDNSQPIDHTDPGRAAALNGRGGYAGPVACVAAILVVVAAILMVKARIENGPRSLKLSVPAHTPAGSTPPGMPTSHRELFQMELDTVAALQRVVPRAAPESDVTWFMLPAQGIGLSLFVRVDGQSGGLRVQSSRSHDEPCDGFNPAACRRESGPDGQVITIAHFDRQVAPGQPRDTEIRATVYRPEGSWVQVSIDNAAAPASPQNPPARTGRPPPLTEEQALALASDPALDFCAVRSDGPCAPG